MRDKILAMEAGRELDVLIAEKLFGAHIITKDSKFSDREFYALIGGEKEKYQPLEKGKTLANVWWRHTAVQAWSACPNYSTDISAAWEIVEKIQKTKLVRLNANEGDYICKIGGDLLCSKSFGKTMPEAICKAALLAVLEELE